MSTPAAPRPPLTASVVTFVVLTALGVVAALLVPGWLHLASFVPRVASDETVVTITGVVAAPLVAACFTLALRGWRGRARGTTAPTKDQAAAVAAGGRWLALGAALWFVATAAAFGVLRQLTGPKGWSHVYGFSFGTVSRLVAGFEVAFVSPLVDSKIQALPEWTEKFVDTGFNWGIVGATALVALLLTAGEVRFLRRRARISKFTPFALVAGVVALLVVGMRADQMKNVQQYYVVRSPVLHEFGKAPHQSLGVIYSAANQRFIHLGYGASVLALDLVQMALMVVVACGAFWLIRLARRRELSAENWAPARAVRNLALVVTAASVVGAILLQFW